MSTITLKKEAAVALRDALSGLIETTKQAMATEKSAADVLAAAEAQKATQLAIAQKLAQQMLDQGQITKPKFDQVVTKLASGEAHVYLKIALDQLAKFSAKTASVKIETPAPLGRKVLGAGQVEKTSSQRLAEADRQFEKRLGL